MGSFDAVSTSILSFTVHPLMHGIKEKRECMDSGTSGAESLAKHVHFFFFFFFLKSNTDIYPFRRKRLELRITLHLMCSLLSTMACAHKIIRGGRVSTL